MSTPLRVLIVEDSEDDAALILRELRRGDYEPASERVDTPAAMKSAVDNNTWDIVISDHNMPGFSAPAALTLLKSSGLDLPFIIVSGAIGEDVAVAAMKAGAHDYVMKGNLARLNPVVERELQEAEQRRARRRAENKERRLHEELTEQHRRLDEEHRQLESQHRELEQRVREITALNSLFQEHLKQRFEVIQAYRDLCVGLEETTRDLNALVERARGQSIPDLQDIPGPPTGGIGGPTQGAPPP